MWDVITHPCHNFNIFKLGHGWEIASSLFYTDAIIHPCLNHDAGHDYVIKWKHIPRYWPFVRGIHRSPVNSQHKGQWRGALMFSLICARINAWVNNREAGDLRRYRDHYDVIVMLGKRGPNRVMLIQGLCSLTHWGRDKMAAVSQTTLSNAFSWMKM